MNSKDIMELKKRFKKNDTTITKIYSVYIDNEGNKICERYENLLVMKDNCENDFYKFLDMQKKTLSCKSMDLNFSSQESEQIKKLITSMYKDKLNNLDLINLIVDELKKNYLEEIKGNLLITFAVDSYDVPAKTTDGFKVDESEEVYSYIICSICPVTTSKAGLGYIEKTNTIGSRYQDWIVNPPELGFIYPSFTDRSSDDSTITYFYKKNLYTSIITNVLKCEIQEDNISATKENSETINEEIESLKVNEESKDTEIKEKIEEPLNIENELKDSFEIKDPKINSETEEILEEPFIENLTEDLEKEEQTEESKEKPDEEFDKFLNKINLLLDENKEKAEIQIINGKKFLLIPME